MNRHPFRWEGLAFGAFFLAVAGNWAVWREDLLTTEEMSYLISSILIVAGVAGVIATFWKPKQADPVTTQPVTTQPVTTEPVAREPLTDDTVTTDTIQIEETHDEATDPQR